MALDEATRVRLGAQVDAAPDVLNALASDGSVTVRAALAMNPATPAETNAALAKDGDDRVRSLLARKLAALVPTLADGAMSVLRQQTLDMLGFLAEDEAVSVRAVIAEAVKELTNVPRDLIARLANDAAAPVCEPVILFSPLLTSGDLVALVVAAPSSATRLAVARRHRIDADVSDAVAAGGTEDVILALLMNGSAHIREATLDALVDRSAAHPAWHGPLTRRPVLSPRSLRNLSRIVADHLLDNLAARGDLDPALAAELRQRVAARMRQQPEPGPRPAPAAKPTEEELLDMAKRGEVRKAAEMLAAAADIPLPVIRRAATLRSAKGLISLVWKAGFSMKAGYAVQVLLAQLPPGAAIKAGPGNAFPLSVEEMSWQLEFLNGKPR